jgi:hypothetical protein
MSHPDFMMSPPSISSCIRHQTSDFENIWTFESATEDSDFISYEVVEPPREDCSSHDISLSDWPQDLSHLQIVDPIMINTKYDSDISPADSSAVDTGSSSPMVPDHMHVSSSAHSPYTDLNQVSPGSLQTGYPASSPTVPSSTPYSGDYSFEVSVQKQPKETKSATWTHSDSLGKLYVRLGAACPFVYRTSKHRSVPHGCVVRVLPVYIRPEHVRDVVRRCPNHVAGALRESGAPADTDMAAQAQHLIRSQHSLAQYTEDPNTRRLSVLIPYEQPQAGAEWVTSLLEFHCFSSCVGGLNRRPVQVIFTLEDSQGNVLGRRAIEVRVCACPGRDRSADERAAREGGSRRAAGTSNGGTPLTSASKQAGGSGTTGLKRSSAILALDEAAFTMGAASDTKRSRTDGSSDGEVFALKVRGRRNYEILCMLRDSLEITTFLHPQLLGQYTADHVDQHQRLSSFDVVSSNDIKSIPQQQQPSTVLPPAGKTTNNNNKITVSATGLGPRHMTGQQPIDIASVSQYRNTAQQQLTSQSYY